MVRAGGAHLKVVTTLLLGRGEPRSNMVLVKGWPSFSQVKLKPKGEASITWKSRTLHTCWLVGSGSLCQSWDSLNGIQPFGGAAAKSKGVYIQDFLHPAHIRLWFQTEQDHWQQPSQLVAGRGTAEAMGESVMHSS